MEIANNGGKQQSLKNKLNEKINLSILETGNIIDAKLAYDCAQNWKNLDVPTKGRTKSIWFSRDFMFFVAQALQADDDVNGVRIYLGAYTDANQEPYRNRIHEKDQISLFWLATRFDSATREHKDDETFFKEKYLELASLNELPPGGALNHGELCPPNAGCINCDGDCVVPYAP
jgi:hypothetical protein